MAPLHKSLANLQVKIYIEVSVSLIKESRQRQQSQQNSFGFLCNALITLKHENHAKSEHCNKSINLSIQVNSNLLNH